MKRFDALVGLRFAPSRFHDQIFIKPLIKMTLFERAHRSTQVAAADKMNAQPAKVQSTQSTPRRSLCSMDRTVVRRMGSHSNSTRALDRWASARGYAQ
jgi:hypothetical protein